jgi:hypothetical protein
LEQAHFFPFDDDVVYPPLPRESVRFRRLFDCIVGFVPVDVAGLVENGRAVMI